MDLEKCTGPLYNNKLSRQQSKGAAEHSLDLDNRPLNSAKSANTASPSFWALSSPPTSPPADPYLIKLSQKASTFGSFLVNVDHLLKAAVASLLYIPQASDVGISFNDALMAESLKKFLSVEGEFLFSLLSEPEIFEMQEWGGGIIGGLQYQELSDLVWLQIRFNRCRSTYTELLKQNPINSTAAGSSCVICVELCRIRSASFGPIRKQIKAMWAQAHTAGP